MKRNSAGNVTKNSTLDEEVKKLPPSPFIQIGAYQEQDGMLSVESARELPGIGVIIRTKHIHETFMTVSEVFVPGLIVRDGQIGRSKLFGM